VPAVFTKEGFFEAYLLGGDDDGVVLGSGSRWLGFCNTANRLRVFEYPEIHQWQDLQDLVEESAHIRLLGLGKTRFLWGVAVVEPAPLCVEGAPN